MGDLNPESVIRERLDEPIGNPLRDRIGLWIGSPDSTDAARAKRPSTNTDANALSTAPSEAGALDSQTVAAVLNQRYTSAMQACTRLPASTREPLTALYFSKVNPIIPLVDQTTHTTSSSTSPFLERAICLIAAKHPTTHPHLRLTENTPTLTPRAFCTELYKGLVSAMAAGLEPDRYTRIRILALMSLHCEGYEGAEAASLHLCEAIHQAQTVGLHLDRPGRSGDGDSLGLLFWGLWTLDKMHACLGGRPVLLADWDIGIERPGQGQSQTQAGSGSGAFRVWLAVSELLATVISFYRPSAGVTSGWEEGFPAFEDIVGEAGQGEMDFATLGMSIFNPNHSLPSSNPNHLSLILPGFLELYYHSVAILSHRSTLSSTPDTNTKFSSIRQGLAAIRIHSIVATECAGNLLPPLPIVAYAISLSMGVSYRQLRSSRLITHFDRARTSLEACCVLLEGMGGEWFSAEAMARLGRRALGQIGGEREHDTEHGHGHERRGIPESESSPGLVGDSSAAVVDGSSGSLEAGHNSTVPMISEVEGRMESSSRAPVEMGSTLASVPVPPVPTSVESEATGMGDLDSSTMMHGFADIDTLFGEFLDISLPTNFWDPIFVEDDVSSGQ